MEKKHITELLPEYLDNLLNETQKKKVETHLKNCKSCSQELNELKKLFKIIGDEPASSPSENVRINFLEQLEVEKQNSSKVVSMDAPSIQKKTNWTNSLLKIAASILLLIGAFVLGSRQSTESSKKEIAQLTEETLEIKQTAMISLMENKSASRRIQGVNYIEELEQPDDAIVKALADRMLYDENTNVRAAAVEVLAKYTKSEKVKDTFIRALKTEKDPGIQIAIIYTLGQIQEKKAAKPMQDLLDREETQPFVKDQIESVLTTII